MSNNIYNYLKVEEPNGIVIDSKNKLRNCKKKLERMKERNAGSSDEKVKEEIRILKLTILEYEKKNIKTLKKKKKKKKNRDLLNDNDNYILNKEIKQNKLNKIKKEVKQKRINKLWKRYLVDERYLSKSPEWGKTQSLSYITGSPKWSIKTHQLFPDNMRRIIIGLFCYSINEDTIFSTLPKEVMEHIAIQFSWIDFPDKDKDKNVIVVNKKGERKRINIRWSV